MRTIIDDCYGIDVIEDWCTMHGIETHWTPIWCGGSVVGWAADLSPDDAFLTRLRFFTIQKESRPDDDETASFIGTNVVPFKPVSQRSAPK